MKTVLVLLVAGALAHAGGAWAVNKCRDETTGRVLYSDLPCPTSMSAEQGPNLTNPSGRIRPPSAAPGGARTAVDTAPLPPIDFGTTTGDRIARAGATVSSILVDARDCDWALKVTRDISQCAPFLQQMVEGREFAQAMSTLSQVASDPTITGEQTRRLSALLRETEEIVRIREFALLRITR